MHQEFITVTQLTKYIKYKIDNDPHLTKIYLKGEISNFKAHTRGHFYFTLKDENTRINAVMFASSAAKVKFVPEDGMKVLVQGRISVYEATGGYQIYVEEMEEDGLGNLYVAFEKLKKKLEQEGLFDPKYKKPIPKIPNTIGIITAPTGAAIKDILSTIKRRWPLAKTILFPSLVQGMEASKDIVRNINLTKDFDLDVLIIGRGGGSIEDMWCFNDEEVARAIFALEVPVISAVGHEIDFTISDFVADLRAPTPTGAAEMAVPHKSDVLNLLNQYESRLCSNMKNLIDVKKKTLTSLTTSFILKNPISIYEVKEQKFDNLFERLLFSYKKVLENSKNRFTFVEKQLENAVTYNFHQNEKRYSILINKLETLNPLLTLKRGYAITKKDGKVIDSIEKINKNDIIQVELKDGEISAKVE